VARRQRNEEQYERQRLRLLTTAAELFASRGYESTTMEDIATALDLTKAGVYYYYPKKVDLLLDICNQTMDEALASVQEASEASTHEERAAQVVITILGRMIAGIAEWSLFFQDASLRSEPRGRVIVEKRQKFIDVIESIIADGMKDGAFREGNPRVAALAIIGMCNWSYTWYRAEGIREDEVIAGFVGFLKHGVLAPA
jgi:AcrR family transcriptional regulator